MVLRAIWKAMAVASMLTLGACFSLAVDTDREPIHTHILNPEWKSETDVHTTGPPSSAVLLVTMPQAQPGYDVPRMVYLRQPHELNYYATHQWVETLPRMLAPLIVQSLERTGVWKSVVQAPTVVRGDYRLDADQITLEQRFFEKPNRVRAAFRAQLIDLRQYGVVGTKWFETFEVAPSEDADGGVTAANRAVGRLLDDLAVWTSECAKHAENC